MRIKKLIFSNLILKWFRTTDSKFIDEIENHETYFLQDNKNTLLYTDTVSLYILTYNYTTHEQLASYKPQMIAIRTETDDSTELINDFNKNSEIFSLAYLKSHEILIDDKTDLKKNDYTCLITVLFPLDESQPTLRAEYNDLLEKYIYIKMIVSSDKTNKSNRKKKFTSQRRIRSTGNEKFLELEFREGPISVYKSDKLRENITCHLKLTDSEDELTAYENTIVKVHDYEFNSNAETTKSTSTKNIANPSDSKPIKKSFYFTIAVIILVTVILMLIILYTILFCCGCILTNIFCYCCQE